MSNTVRDDLTARCGHRIEGQVLGSQATSRWRPSKPALVAVFGVVTGLFAWGLLGDGAGAGQGASIYGLCALVGVLSGFLSGLLGIGGGLVTVPALYMVLPHFGVAADQLPHTVVATALVAMVPTAIAAGWSQHRSGALVWSSLMRLAPGMAIGGALGALFALQLRGVALSLLFAAQSLYYGINLLRAAPSTGSARARISTACSAAPMWLAAAATATFSSCVGMGAGSLIVPYLVGRAVRLRQAVATACVLNLCLAVSAALVFISAPGDRAGAVGEPQVCWSAALLIGAVACMTVPSGVGLAHRLPLWLFRRLLGAITLLGAAALTFRALTG